MGRRRYISCKNYESHMTRVETLENINSYHYGCYVVLDMAYCLGWERTTEGWLCPECVKCKTEGSSTSDNK